MTSNALDRLKELTTIVADTGDFAQMREYKPQDATTNPSLITAAASMPEYRPLLDAAVAWARGKGGTEAEQVERALDKVAVNFGLEILKIIPGRVSTEVDARLSFDTDGTVRKARELAQLYRDAGIDPSERVLFKIASTWEGLRAAAVLEAEGLHCNLTLMFSLVQAAVAGEVGATLVSPFAGRITDFFKSKNGWTGPPPVEEDPGVLSVRTIYRYLKKFGYKTVVMGASFRTKDQCIALAGCDLLTISPTLLGELQATDVPVPRVLDASASADEVERVGTDEASFRWALNEDEMATTKLAEGIRRFAADLVKLEATIKEMLSSE